MKRMIFTLFLLLTATSVLFAQEGTLKSLLVSIEKYEISPLDFAERDVEKLGILLQTRYNFTSQACIDSATDDVSEDAPMQSVMQKIESWCNTLGSEDTAILYLAGHGVKDENGKLYLAMINFNRRNFDQAAIPLEWIREQFGKSKARHKLLLLDTCYSGTAKSADFNQAGAGEAGKVFSNLKDVVTIASSRDNEKSWLWNDESHSLFTYWLIEAFKGHADADGNRILTCEELIEYLENNVSWSAEVALGKEQHPVVLNATAGADFQLPIRAIPLTKLIDDVAEQIDLQMRLEKFPSIGIPEFTSGTSKSFDPQYGTLPKLVADSLRKSLGQKARKNRSGYEILSENALREELQSKGLTPNDLGTDKTKDIKIVGVDIPILVDGHLSLFGNGGLLMRAALLNTKGKSEVAQAGGAAMLSQSDLAQTGISANFADTASSSTPPPPVVTVTPAFVNEPGVGMMTPFERENAEKMREAANHANPLKPTDEKNNAQKDKKFVVWFETRPIGSRGGYKKVDLQFPPQGNDCYLAIDKGVEYLINFKSAYPDDVFARVLVDGLNTLSQEESTISRDITIEALDPAKGGEYVIAPRVPLEEARPWFVFKGTSLNCISGFVDANGKNDTLRRFQVVDADQSVAKRKNYTDQTGMITVAFYKAVIPASRRGEAPPANDQQLGTDMADPEKVKLKYVKTPKVPGELLAVFNIRYMTPDALKKLMQSQQ